MSSPMPDLEMIQKPRSKSINGLGQNSPKINPNVPIVREIDYPRFARPEPVQQPAEAQAEPVKENLDKGFITGNKLLVAYGWWILGAFIAMVIGILLWMGVFGRLSAAFIPNLYRHCHAAVQTQLPAFLFFSALIQFAFISTWIPGATLFQIFASHLIGNFTIALWLQIISVNMSILAVHLLIKNKAKDSCKKRMARDSFFPTILEKSQKYPIIVSSFCWGMFIPYNYKTYVLSAIDQISGPAFYFPSLPFVAAHSAIYAYLGTSIPYLLHKHKSLDQIIYSHFTTQEATLIVFLFLIIFATKFICLVQDIGRGVKNYRHKSKKIQKEENSDSVCSDDARTCVSLDLTLQSVS